MGPSTLRLECCCCTHHHLSVSTQLLDNAPVRRSSSSYGINERSSICSALGPLPDTPPPHRGKKERITPLAASQGRCSPQESMPPHRNATRAGESCGPAQPDAGDAQRVADKA